MAQRAKRNRGRPVTHDLSRTRAYNRWRWLRYAHTHKRYSRKVHGCEITLCEEWRGKKGLIQFHKDMGEPEPAARIKFHDITKPISKNNCYWGKPVLELTAEELRLATYRLKIVMENYKVLLNGWERKFCSRLTNYLKGNKYISRQCFLKIHDIYVKTVEISGQAVHRPAVNAINNFGPPSDTPANTIEPTAPEKTRWERLLETRKQLAEKNDTNKPHRDP